MSGLVCFFHLLKDIEGNKLRHHCLGLASLAVARDQTRSAAAGQQGRHSMLIQSERVPKRLGISSWHGDKFNQWFLRSAQRTSAKGPDTEGRRSPPPCVNLACHNQCSYHENIKGKHYIILSIANFNLALIKVTRGSSAGALI